MKRFVYTSLFPFSLTNKYSGRISAADIIFLWTPNLQSMNQEMGYLYVQPILIALFGLISLYAGFQCAMVFLLLSSILIVFSFRRFTSLFLSTIVKA